MRFDALHLSAVGPFTERSLDLSAGEHGVHVLYGPNEAGKSSALRAVRALLFGFHAQTRDDFVHRYDKLRVGADLRTRDGERVTVFRRKGRKDTLLDGDGKSIPEDTVAVLLGGVSEAVFAIQFGIDHAALLEGGHALIQEHGNEAQALFGASLGSNEVHAVLASLDAQAQALFAPRASSRVINKLITEVEDLRKREREVTLLGTQFQEARREVNSARLALHEADRERDEAVREQARLARIHAAQGPLARRARSLQALAELVQVPELPSDFAARRRRASDLQRDAAARAARAVRRLEALEREGEDVAVSEAVLAQQAGIESVRERLVVHEKAAADRVRPAAGHDRLQEDLARLRERCVPALREAALGVLRTHLGRQRRAEELVSEHAALAAALDAARRRCGESEQHRQGLEQDLRALPAPADITVLQQAVDAARRVGDLDGQITELEADAAEHARNERQDLSALGRWTRDREALLEAALPDEEAIHVFATRCDALDERCRRIAERMRDASTRRDAAQEALQAQLLGVAPPTEAQLEAVRAHRDAGWALLRARWIDGVDIEARARAYAGDAEVADVFQLAMGEGDVLADRLRREAAAVHERATRVAARDAASRELEMLREERCDLEAQRASCAADWEAAWAVAQITPASPKEMLRWRQRAEQIRARARVALAVHDRLQHAQARRASLCESLLSALRAVAVPVACTGAPLLGPTLSRSEAERVRIEAIQTRRATLLADLAEAQTTGRRCDDEYEAARAALDAWLAQWAAFTDELSLPGTVTPGELRDHFDLLREVVSLGERLERDGARLAAIDADAAAFASATRELCAALAPALAQAEPVAAARGLVHLLDEQRQAALAQASLDKQVRDARRELDEAHAELAGAASELASLCALAGGVEIDALERVEQRDQARRVARTQLDEAELELANLGAGATPRALAQAAAQEDADELQMRLAALADRIERELAPRRDELIRRKQDAERVLAAMAGSSDAAAIAVQREQRLAELRAQAQYYLRLRLAASLLREQMNRLQRDHGDPILASAGGYLRTLTGGRYVAVRSEFDDADQAVLCAVRAEGEGLRVEALSTGTRDQLYLALRLATLERHLGHGEPLPFVVDDILVQFDDERTRATLQALAEFSRHTQVLLFSHHARVAQDAAALAGSGGGVFVHDLQGS